LDATCYEDDDDDDDEFESAGEEEKEDIEASNAFMMNRDFGGE